MSGFINNLSNLPPGCSDSDIERAQGAQRKVAPVKVKNSAKERLRTLQRARAQFRVREAEIAVAWSKGSPTARVDRAELELEMRTNALEIREAEYLVEREGDERRREHDLAISGKQWSDQMVAALTYLLTQGGQRDIVNQAQKMVQDGWPKPKEEEPA